MLRRIWITFFSTLAFAAHAYAVDPGAEAPDFTMTNGKSLSELRGKVIYVDFWASWCGPCQMSFPWMEEVQNKYQGLKVIAVNVDADREDADRFLESAKPSFEIVFDPDGKIPEAYGVEGMPSSYLIGPDGKVVSTHRGFRENDKAVIEKEIQMLLGAPPK